MTDKDKTDAFNIKPAIRITAAILGLCFGIMLLFTEVWSLNMFWFPAVLIGLSAAALILALRQRKQKLQTKDKS